MHVSLFLVSLKTFRSEFHDSYPQTGFLNIIYSLPSTTWLMRFVQCEYLSSWKMHTSTYVALHLI